MSILERVSIGSLAQGAVPPGYTFTRSTTATYIDSDGLLKVAAINTPRRQWDSANRRWGYVGEPGRTNLLLRSEEFDNASWTKNDCTITANATTAPDGTSTADLLNSTAGGGRATQGVIAVASGTHSCTFFIKASTSALVTVLVRNNTTATNIAVANFSTSTGASSAVSAGTAIEGVSIGDGWWRVAVVTTTGITAGDTVIAYMYPGNSAGTGATFVWGAQLEAGPYPTSYIPTTTVAVSRGADLLTRALTGPEGTALSTQGTMVVEFSYLGGDSAAGQPNRKIWALDDGTGANRLVAYSRATTIGAETTGATPLSAFLSGVIPTSTPAKLAAAWAANSGAVSLNGGTVGTDATVVVPSLTKIAIGGNSYGGSEEFGGLIYGWTLYDSRLTNAELQALSSPTVSRNSGSLRLGLGLGL